MLSSLDQNDNIIIMINDVVHMNGNGDHPFTLFKYMVRVPGMKKMLLFSLLPNLFFQLNVCC